jgi:Na+/proline symporter
MSLGERIPDESTLIHRRNATTLFWIALFSFIGAFVIFLLLQRLGLPSQIVIGSILIMAVALIICLAWISRTMTSLMFFFANRALGPFTSGLGSTTDFLSGSLLILLFSINLTGKMVLVIALVLGVLLHASLFSANIRRAGVLSLPGFFAWRIGSKFTGYLVLPVATVILFALAMAEFQVAGALLQAMTGLTAQQSIWIVILLAVLPSVFGGWSGLLLVNACLAIWMLTCALIPASVTGFLPSLLVTPQDLELVDTPLQILNLVESTLLFGSTGTASTSWLVLTMLTAAAGFSVLPHALSRLSTNSRPIEAIESVGWLALMCFLMFSALPLSVGLIVGTPTSGELATLLQNQPILQMLPYFVILFAALNGLAATLFTAAASIIRATNRLRNIDPGEQSVFLTRLTVLILAVGLIAWPEELILTTEELLIGALMMGAGGIFVPLVAGIWFGSISRWALNAAIAGGALVTAYLLYPVGPVIAGLESPVAAGAVGATLALLILLVDRSIQLLRKVPAELNSSAQMLRRH